jgi:hypothetical protein
MSSPSLCAGGIIASFIATATKLRGGAERLSIHWPLPGRCGLRRIGWGTRGKTLGCQRPLRPHSSCFMQKASARSRTLQILACDRPQSGFRLS